jgi:hypothetical protein
MEQEKLGSSDLSHVYGECLGGDGQRAGNHALLESRNGSSIRWHDAVARHILCGADRDAMLRP